MSEKLRWGILASGNIAAQFATGVNESRRCQLAAVGSRTADAAQRFASAHKIPAAHASYEQLIGDPAIDAVYVALPNSLHHDWTIRALRAGKHVLCEKPLAANLREAQEMFDVALATGRVLVEAFMYRSHPLTHAVMAKINGGAIGEVRLIRTSFCYSTSRIAGNIRFDAELAGGALMDIGCYCINFSRLVAGREPLTVRADGRLHESGVDEVTVGTLQFPGGILASFTCGMTVHADNSAYVCGTDGYIQTPVPWKPAARAAYIVARNTPPRMDRPAAGPPVAPKPQEHSVDAGMDIYGLEADDFAACVLDGKPPAVSRDDSLGNMRILDELRRQVGMRI